MEPTVPFVHLNSTDITVAKNIPRTNEPCRSEDMQHQPVADYVWPLHPSERPVLITGLRSGFAPSEKYLFLREFSTNGYESFCWPFDK